MPTLTTSLSVQFYRTDLQTKLLLLAQEKETVEGDAVLWLRMMTIYVVAEETARRQGKGTVGFVKDSREVLETTGWMCIATNS